MVFSKASRALGFSMPVLLLAVLELSSGACANKHSESPASAPLAHADAAKISLVTSDIQAFSAMLAPTRSAGFSCSSRQVFNQLFGGLSADDVRAYFNARIKYFVTSQDQVGLSVDPASLHDMGWLQEFGLFMGDATSAVLGEKKAGAQDHQEALLGGQNLGTAYWFISIVNRVPLTVVVDNEMVPATSSRVGVMLIGEGYQVIEDREHNDVALGVRQGILVHEARHSDCTGGVTEHDLDIVRAAASNFEFSKTFPKMACGHFHSYCPDTPGLEALQGLAACDDHPWGAYSVGFFYQKALAEGAPRGSSERAELEAAALDSFSRLQFDTDAMLSGKDGGPDMQNQGLLD